ncbi:MAG: NAD-dependent epimerase/dehydratase family protein [Elusimicrobiota bacterium]|nr:MAG: NAD-dependent epimerase/dehydratase family protein [Elusimicrobiota bacterium]
MKVFVTGATGYIGRAVAEAFRRKGHQVAGLTRSAAKAAELDAREIEPVVGDMRDYSTWEKGASGADVHVHCAVEYGAEYQALDRATVEALLGLGGRLIYTSGVWQYGPCGDAPVDETDAFTGKPLLPWRSDHEELVMLSRGLVIRPGCVYGATGGLTALWFEGAAEKKAAPIVGEGNNRWAMIHRDDLAELYVRAAERGADGALFNGADRSRQTVREMASAASRAAGAEGALQSLTLGAAEKRWGDGARPGPRPAHRLLEGDALPRLGAPLRGLRPARRPPPRLLEGGPPGAPGVIAILTAQQNG